MPASEEAFRCKYCQGFFVDKKSFLKHKKDVHWEELSNRSDIVSVSSDLDASMAPPPNPPRRQRVSRVPTTATSPPPPRESPPKSPGRRPTRSKPQEPEPAEPPVAKKGRKSKTIAPKNMPARIGRKQKGPDGEEVAGEWHRNPKFNSG